VLELKNLKKICEVSKWWDEKSAKLCERTHKSGGMKRAKSCERTHKCGGRREQNCVTELINVVG